MRTNLILGLLIAGFGLMACHQPERFVSDSVGQDTSVVSTAGKVSPVNTGRQICNPAISADTVNYPGSMLWLGFSGQLVVKDPPADYTTSDAVQHDRLTISRADNSVAWFLLMDSVPAVQCEFQDPDWTTHPDWIVSMGARTQNNDCANEEYLYSGWVIRPTDNARFRFNRDGLEFMSTPHVWIASSVAGPDSASVMDSTTFMADGFASKVSVQTYFGTDQVKVAWSKEESGYSLYFIDYTVANPAPIRLRKPAGKETWKAESGMISPDGRWIAYNLYERQDQYEAYIQELRADAQPILVATGAMDPRWWVSPADPARLYLVYMTVPSGESYIQRKDLLDPTLLANGSAGATWLQEVKLNAGLPQSLAVEWIGNARKLVDLPFRGGLSPDGHFLGTGTNNGYMMELF